MGPADEVGGTVMLLRFLVVFFGRAFVELEVLDGGSTIALGAGIGELQPALTIKIKANMCLFIRGKVVT